MWTEHQKHASFMRRLEQQRKSPTITMQVLFSCFCCLFVFTLTSLLTSPSSSSWILDSTDSRCLIRDTWIPDNQSLMRFRIPWVELQIPKPRIPDSKILDSGILISSYCLKFAEGPWICIKLKSPVSSLVLGFWILIIRLFYSDTLIFTLYSLYIWI